MKKLFVLLCFSVLCFTGYSQNIVPNPSFEIYSTCPYGVTMVPYGGFGSAEIRTSWYLGTAGTSDYFNVCDSIAAHASAWVPHNLLGNQTPFHGDGYAGVLTFYESASRHNDGKEYLMCRLPPMHRGAKYKVSMRVSLGDYSEIATDGLGVWFNTYGSPDTMTYLTIRHTPQVDFTRYGIIRDLTNWVLLVDSFIADSAYTVMLIGGFRDSATMHTDSVRFGYYPGGRSYYFIDSVSVEPTNPTFLSVTDIGGAPSSVLSPNPFSDHANIEFTKANDDQCKLVVFDAVGRQVQIIEGIKDNQVQIHRNNLNAGLYYYKILNNEGVIAQGRFQVVN